jgi:3-oxoacyl-[acyl-carrier-protein] synthase III
MFTVRIAGTASVIPERMLTTRELVARALPGVDPDDVEAKSGIRTRAWVEPGTTMAELGARALAKALARAGLEAKDLRRILFVCSTGGDSFMPTTASAITERLGLRGTCDAYDLSNSCVGFLTALDIGARAVATGLSPVEIVVVEIPSRHMLPEDHRPYLVMGDGAGAAVLTCGGPDEGILGAAFGTDTTLGNTVQLAHPGVTGAMEHVHFLAPSRELTQIAIAALVRAARAALEPSGTRIEEIEWVVPHQPNGRMLEKMLNGLGVNPARVVPVVQELGSLGAASIPVSLDRLLRTRPVRPGDRILLAGIGAGVSYGALLYRVGSSYKLEGTMIG